MFVAMIINKPWIDTKYITIFNKNILTKDCDNMRNEETRIN